jgi:hypothetical protein
MPPKRASEDEPQLISKIQRIEHGVSTSPPQHHHALAANNDFSTSVKRKLADSKRTGQACDRCKVRTRPLLQPLQIRWDNSCVVLYLLNGLRSSLCVVAMRWSYPGCPIGHGKLQDAPRRATLHSRARIS